MDRKPVVTRIPPSPTGHLHIGTARTALFNFLFAKHHGGEMVFRSEDTDQARSSKEYEAEIIEGLKWLGLSWKDDEVHRQSERTAIYKKYLEKMIGEGSAYISKEESKQNIGETVEVIRLKNPNKTITFQDEIRGEISFDTTELGDIVIARNINDPLYHLTVVVDDHEMGVTHVLRGEDHISNTPRQILIQEAIGAERPIYAHLPLILAPDRSKMSKRHGAVSLHEYQADGFLKEAIINYLALLGWNSGTDQELFTLDELVEQFSLEGVQKGGAMFDLQKFQWINKQYLEKLSATEFMEYVRPAFGEKLTYTEDRFEKMLPTIQERIHTKAELERDLVAGEYDWLFDEVEYETELLKWKNDDSAAAALPRLQTARSLLETADFSSPETIKSAVWSYAEEIGKGEVLWPLRVALSGKERSPDPFTLAFVLGTDEALRRIDTACDKIDG